MISGDLTERETEGLQHMYPSGTARTPPPPPHFLTTPQFSQHPPEAQRTRTKAGPEGGGVSQGAVRLPSESKPAMVPKPPAKPVCIRSNRK